MFCSQCGTNLEVNAKFCSKCGHPTVENHAPKFQETVTGTISTAVPPTTEYPKQIGTKWLKFWNYISLPIGGILNLFFGYLMLLNFPIVGIIMIAIAIIQFAVVYGLHYRKLWAWQWNWVVIGVAYLGMLIPILPNGSDSDNVVMQFMVRLVVGSLIWMWPNYVYWNKRKILFFDHGNDFAGNVAKNPQVDSVQVESKFSVYKEHNGLTAIIAAAALIGIWLLVSQLQKPAIRPSTYEEPVSATSQLTDSQLTQQSVSQNPTQLSAAPSLDLPILTPFQEKFNKANSGDALAQNELGVMYSEGEGVVKNDVEAIKWFRKAAEQNVLAAQFNLGIMYSAGRGVLKDHVKAIEWLRRSADQGFPDSQNQIGNMYNVGLGVSKNQVEAVKWYRKSAEQFFAPAQNNLGSMYIDGHGVKKDITVGTNWLIKAADQGNLTAKHSLCVIFGTVYNTKKNYIEALKWCHQAAEKGDAESQNLLGKMYTSGDGVTVNYIEAVKWYRKAAEQGFAVAQYNLGYFYAEGWGVSQDYEKAVYWFKKSADQGFALAQKALNEFNVIGTIGASNRTISRIKSVQAASASTENNTSTNNSNIKESNGVYEIQTPDGKGSISGDLPKLRQQMQQELQNKGLYFPGQ